MIAEARAYRHRSGNFIVTITRDGRSRRYRVSPERHVRDFGALFCSLTREV